MARPLSLHEFKNWFLKQEDLQKFFDISSCTDQEKPAENKYEQYIGRDVVAKVSIKKLIEKIEEPEADADLMISEFMQSGGSVIDVNGKNVVIEVESGTFSLPRFCVTPKK